MKKGLIAYYPFNGNAKDESGNGHEGKVNGAALANDRHGDSNMAYSFDGADDEIIVDHKPELNAFPITLSVWIRYSGKEDQSIVSKYMNASYNGFYLHKFYPKSVGCSYLSSVHIGIGGDRKNPETNVLSENTWHHIIITVNENKYALFAGGILTREGLAPKGITKPTSRYPLRIGSFNSPGRIVFYFKGQIDDVRIYNRALTEAEVKALFEFEKVKE